MSENNNGFEIDQERAEENFRRLEEALQSSQPIRRQPHLGYGVVFAASAFLLLLVATSALVFLVGLHDHKLQKDALEKIANLPRISVYAMGIAYAGTFSWAFFLYPRFWQRPYFDVLQWNFAAVRRYWRLLLLGGVGLSAAAGLAERFVTVPDTAPMNAFFKNPLDLWLITIFGSTIAPFFEEMIFRGYLLPGVAIAFDWLRMERSDTARAHWESTDTLSLQAILFSGIVTSIGFASLHASQLADTWGAVALLFCVSCVLTTVRVRLRSLAASTLLHAAYNCTLFLLTFIATGGYRHLDKLQQ